MRNQPYTRKNLTFTDGWVSDWTYETVVVRYDMYNGAPYDAVTINIGQPNPLDIDYHGERAEDLYSLVRIILTDDACEFAEWSLVNDLLQKLSGDGYEYPGVYPVAKLPEIVSVFNALGRLDWLRFEYLAITDPRAYNRKVQEQAARRAEQEGK